MTVARRLWRLAVLLSSVLLLLQSTSAKADSRLQLVTIARNSSSGNIVYLQLDVAEALHYFEDEGLSAQFRYFAGGSTVAAALLSGKTEFSANSVDHAIALQNEPVHLEMVASFTDLPAVSVVIRRSLRPVIRGIGDLRGRRIGISALGSGTYVIANAILQSAGVPANAVQFVTLSMHQSLVDSVRKANVDAVITTDPIAVRLLVDENCSLLLDLVTPDETERVFRGGYQFTGLLTRSDTVAKDPVLVQKMVNIMVRANRYIGTHSATDIASILRPATIGDRFLFVKSVEHTRPSFSKTGYIEPQNVQNTIRAYENLSGRHVGLSIYDDQFAKVALSH